jgi:hypothetical protein
VYLLWLGVGWRLVPLGSYLFLLLFQYDIPPRKRQDIVIFRYNSELGDRLRVCTRIIRARVIFACMRVIFGRARLYIRAYVHVYMGMKNQV